MPPRHPQNTTPSPEASTSTPIGPRARGRCPFRSPTSHVCRPPLHPCAAGPPCTRAHSAALTRLRRRETANVMAQLEQLSREKEELEAKVGARASSLSATEPKPPRPIPRRATLRTPRARPRGARSRAAPLVPTADEHAQQAVLLAGPCSPRFATGAGRYVVVAPPHHPGESARGVPAHRPLVLSRGAEDAQDRAASEVGTPAASDGAAPMQTD